MGYKGHNKDLRLELIDDPNHLRREDGKYGRLEGVRVKVLAAGSGQYQEMWEEFVGKVVDRSQVVAWILQKRQDSPEFRATYPTLNKNFNGLNANCLVNTSIAKHEPGKSGESGCSLIVFLLASGHLLALGSSCVQQF